MTAIPDGPIDLEGRIMQASNATFVGDIGETRVVYKPIRGEQPLWDFPGATLAHREVAAYLLSEALGWNIVPTTVLRDGPLGPGMVQLWKDSDAAQDPVLIVPEPDVENSLRNGNLHILDAVDQDDHPVSLLHEDTEELRKMALYDVLSNNADRKAGHILPMPDGHRFGVDHGLTFHTEPKLRTVLWGWAGEPLRDDEISAVTALRDALGSEAPAEIPDTASDSDNGIGDTSASTNALANLEEDLSEFLTIFELEALVDRCNALLQTGTFPSPMGYGPAVPWPVF